MVTAEPEMNLIAEQKSPRVSKDGHGLWYPVWSKDAEQSPSLVTMNMALWENNCALDRKAKCEKTLVQIYTSSHTRKLYCSSILYPPTKLLENLCQETPTAISICSWSHKNLRTEMFIKR